MAKKNGKISAAYEADITKLSGVGEEALNSKTNNLPRRRKDGVREDLYNDYYAAYKEQFASKLNLEK